MASKITLRLLHLLEKASWSRWVLLMLLIALSMAFYSYLENQERKLARADFSNEVKKLEKIITYRLRTYEQMLIGLSGLYASSTYVDRDEFAAYVAHLDIAKHYQGAQAVSFSEWLNTDELSVRKQQLAQEGMENFTLLPLGVRKHYAPIIYTEPFVESNRTTQGFDVYSETVRRTAMNYAVATNSVSLTAKVELFQQQGSGNAGFVFYYPVYKKEMPVSTESERWQALAGFVHMAFRADDFFKALLVDQDLAINFDVYTSHNLVPDKKIFTFTPEDVGFVSPHEQKLKLEFYGQVWLVRLTGSQAFQSAHINFINEGLLILALIISALIFLLFSVFSSRRESAENLAFSMSDEFRKMALVVQEKNTELEKVSVALQHNVQQLENNEDRFRLALDASRMGVWSWDLIENTIHWDKSMYALFNLQEQSELSSYESFMQHLHPEDAARVFEEIAYAIEKRKDYESEYRIILPDTGVAYIASRAKIIIRDDDGAGSMIGICWDVTEKRRLDKLKTEFVSTVSHELRTPLTAITGALGIAVSGALGELSDKAKSVLDIAYKNSQRLKLLINDLLDMDKLLAGKLEFHCQPTLLLPMIERAVSENKAYADQYQVSYRITKIDPTFKINVEETRFLQIMANFLSNAAKFSPAGKDVIVSVSKQQKLIRVAVSDQGSGIPEAAQYHMFEKFYQADSSDTRKKGGTGLGLAISKEMAERMNGKVGFMSDMGLGSTFYVEFPLL